jgi:hypothetical protein
MSVALFVGARFRIKLDIALLSSAEGGKNVARRRLLQTGDAKATRTHWVF